MFLPKFLKFHVFQWVLINFLVLSAGAQTRSKIEDSNCELFLREKGFVQRNLRLFKFNTAGTERVLNEVSGVQFISDDILGPAPTTVAKVPEDKNLKQVLDWFDRYGDYSLNIERLQRAIGRFVGENSLAFENLDSQVSDGETRDPHDDRIRIQGRIKLLEQALADSEKADPQKAFPVTIVFPRTARRIQGEVVLQRISSLLVQKTFRSRKELKFFLKNDLKELGRLQGYLIKREIEQAELYIRIRKFHDAFPDGAYENLQARLKKAEEKRVQAQFKGQNLVDPRKDPFYARDYAIVDLFERASNFLEGTDPKLVALRPTKRSLDFIEALMNTGKNNQVLTVRSWEPVVRRYMQWSYDWMGAINKSVALIRQPIVTYSGVLIIAGAMGSGLTWAYKTVYRPAHDYVIYNPQEIKAREYYDSLVELRKNISDVSVTYKDFYRRFFDYAQANYSDEAITVAFEYLRKIRPMLEATEKLDPEFTAEQRANFTRQAKEIVQRRDHLLFGYQCQFGSINAVSPRLDRRGKNYFLVEEIWKSQTPNATQSNGPAASTKSETSPSER